MKTQAEFESRLNAQEERVRIFSDNAEELIKSDHVHASYIDSHRVEILKNRNKIYVAATQRRTKLEQALVLENLRRTSNELKYPFSFGIFLISNILIEGRGSMKRKRLLLMIRLRTRTVLWIADLPNIRLLLLRSNPIQF